MRHHSSGLCWKSAIRWKMGYIYLFNCFFRKSFMEEENRRAHMLPGGNWSPPLKVPWKSRCDQSRMPMRSIACADAINRACQCDQSRVLRLSLTRAMRSMTHADAINRVCRCGRSRVTMRSIPRADAIKPACLCYQSCVPCDQSLVPSLPHHCPSVFQFAAIRHAREMQLIYSSCIPDQLLTWDHLTWDDDGMG